MSQLVDARILRSSHMSVSEGGYSGVRFRTALLHTIREIGKLLDSLVCHGYSLQQTKSHI